MKNKEIEIVEIKDSVKEDECKKIVEKISGFKDSFKVALDEHGKELTSIEFSKFIKETEKDIIFIIGGPDGLDERVLSSIDFKLSLSKMTLNHEMARLFLIEQIYRAFTILEGKKYHRF